MLACALAHMAARGLEVVSSATFFAAQQDFAEAGDLLLFVSDDWLGDLEKRMDAAQGVLPSAAMADTFNMLRANDLIWSFFVNNYLLGKEPAAFDLLFWNSDQTRMPKALHMGYLRQFYQSNLLVAGLGGLALGTLRRERPGARSRGRPAARHRGRARQLCEGSIHGVSTTSASGHPSNARSHRRRLRSAPRIRRSTCSRRDGRRRA